MAFLYHTCRQTTPQALLCAMSGRTVAQQLKAHVHQVINKITTNLEKSSGVLLHRHFLASQAKKYIDTSLLWAVLLFCSRTNNQGGLPDPPLFIQKQGRLTAHIQTWVTGILLFLLAQLSCTECTERDTRSKCIRGKKVEVQSSAKRTGSSLQTAQLPSACEICSSNIKQKTHLSSTERDDWKYIEVEKKVNKSSSPTHGFTSVDHFNSYFNWLFDLFLITDSWGMLTASYFGRNCSVCIESSTSNVLFAIDQDDISELVRQTSWLIAILTALSPTKTTWKQGNKQVWSSGFLRCWALTSHCPLCL